MRISSRALAAIALVLPLLLVGTTGSHASSTSSLIMVEVDETAFDAGPGEKISFTSTVTNTGEESLSGLIAHLNILTSDPGVYVDPEDWSAKRTQYLDDLSSGDSQRLTWTVQAVTSGPLILYVAVSDTGKNRVYASEPIEMTVGGQRVVNSGGVLPLVLWMPAGVLGLLGATLLRRRRHQ